MANKLMERCLPPLGIRKMQTKTTVRCYFTLTRMAIEGGGGGGGGEGRRRGRRGRKASVGEDVGKSESFYIADENVKWCKC